MANGDLLPTTSTDTAPPPAKPPTDTAPPPAKPPTDYSSLLPTKEQAETARTGLTAAYEKHEKDLGGIVSQFEETNKRYKARQEQMINAEGATIDELKHGAWNAGKEMADRQVDIWEQFGSPGFLIAMLGSSFSAMPMNSALNAGGAAMNAINEGKMNEYNRAFEAWRANTDLVIKRQQMEHEVYEDVMKSWGKDLTLTRTKLEVAATRFGDERMLALLRADMLPEIHEAVRARADSIAAVATATNKIWENDLRQRVINAKLGWDRDDPKKKVFDPQRIQQVIQDYDNPANDGFNKALRAKQDQVWKDEQRLLTPDEIHAEEKKSSEAKYAYRLASNYPSASAAITDIRNDPDIKLTPEMENVIEKVYSGKDAGSAARVAHVNAALNEIRQRIQSGEQLDSRAQEAILDEALQRPVIGKAFTAPETKFLSGAPELMRNLETLDHFASATGPIVGIPGRLAAEYGGINDPAIIWQTAVRQAEAALAELESSGRVSVVGLHKILETLPEDYHSARFGKFQVQEAMQTLRNKAQAELSVMESSGKKIPANVLDAFAKIGVYPSGEAAKDPLVQLRKDPTVLSLDALEQMSTYMASLPLEDQELILKENRRRIAKRVEELKQRSQTGQQP